jgi:hypothetical protein
LKHQKVAVGIDFPAMVWVKIETGGSKGRMKRHVSGNGDAIRILEIDPKWNETEWCTKGHMGYVLRGVLNLRQEGGLPLEIRTGQGFSIPQGCAHKATCERTTKMFMVDRS